MDIEGIEITHPDKLIYPEKGITKKDLVEYYHKISSEILPHLKNRPLTLHRFPEGIDKEGFYQKNAFNYFPDFIPRKTIPTESAKKTQFYCDSLKALIYLVNQGTISFHIWQAREDRLNEPDKVVFDLDAPESKFDLVKESAFLIGQYLRKKGKAPQLLTSGNYGLHIWYPVQRVKTFEERRDEIMSMAEELVSKYPEFLTTAIRVDDRKGKVFVDSLRNAYGQTSICPYSLRANLNAGVATPIEWPELSSVESGDHYHYGNIFRRLGQKET